MYTGTPSACAGFLSGQSLSSPLSCSPRPRSGDEPPHSSTRSPSTTLVDNIRVARTVTHYKGSGAMRALVLRSATSRADQAGSVVRGLVEERHGLAAIRDSELLNDCRNVGADAARLEL